jgi:hypothetical protein
VATFFNTQITASDQWFDIITVDLPSGKYWLDAIVRFAYSATPNGSYSSMVVRLFNVTTNAVVPHSPTTLYATQGSETPNAPIAFQDTRPMTPVLVTVPLIVGAVAQWRIKLQAMRTSVVGSVTWGSTYILSDNVDTSGMTILRYRPQIASH